MQRIYDLHPSVCACLLMFMDAVLVLLQPQAARSRWHAAGVAPSVILARDVAFNVLRAGGAAVLLEGTRCIADLDNILFPFSLKLRY